MTDPKLERQARELLAAEYADAPTLASMIRRGARVSNGDVPRAIRAIVAALAQQPATGTHNHRLKAQLEQEWANLQDLKRAYQTQQPAAVDDAMVARAVAGYETGPWAAFSPEESREAHRERMRAALTAALAAQHGGKS